MTDYEQLKLQLKICELSMMQVGLELEYNGRIHMETESVLEITQENIRILTLAIQEACNVKTK